MNRAEFISTGGYPLKAERLQELQAAYSIFNHLGAIIGNTAIVSGCAVTGSTTANGVVYVNGELFEFVGGTTQTTVRIIEEPIYRAFKNGENKIVYKRRYITFATGTGAINWSEFKRADTMLALVSRVNTLDQKLADTQASLASATNALQQAIAKLATIQNGAQVNVQADYTENNPSDDAYIKNKPSANAFLRKASYTIGDVDGTDVIKTITFPSVGTSNYIVVGSMVSNSADYNADNDVIWAVKSKTSTSFKLILRETAGVLQNIIFQYALIPL